MQRYTLTCLVCILFLGLQNCKDGKKFHDEAPESKVVAISKSEAAILEFQKSLNAEFKNPETSPLPDRYRKDFEGLDFFEPDTAYQVQAKLVRTPEAQPFLMPTNTERESEEVVYGVVYFELKGAKFQLEVYQTIELKEEAGFEDYLFLPFTDATNGKETYGGGRYIDVSIPSGETLLIDFNKAYNPYCAYNKKYSCPLVPKVNNLEIAVTAGVKAFKK
jgi:uncharacterized protein (DUF1684 family)